MIIVDKEEQIKEFRELIKDHEYFILPIFSDSKYHPMNNDVSVLWIYFFNLEKDFIFPLHHCDSIIDTKEILSTLNTSKRKFTFGKKRLLHFMNLDNVIDLELVIYLIQGDHIDLNQLKTPTHKFYDSLYQNISHINRIIPILKHIEYFEKIKVIFKDVLEKNYDFSSKEFVFYNEKLIPALYGIEKSGLRYDLDIFKEYFLGKLRKHKANKDYLYCQFHPYSTTGRPSNTFGGINFSALPKDTGVRRIFQSRFRNGRLVEFDYDSYHLRLIAERINYKFPDNKRIHEYFGKYYFGKEKLTEEEYNESKSISFRLLYGGIDSAFLHIPYFQKVDDLIYRLWQKFNRVGYIQSPISQKKLFKSNINDEMNKYKLWNYFIQLIETEHSIKAIYEIQEKLKDKNTKIILYTYDSFLFDFDINEKELIIEIKEILEKEGFPVKVSYGENYHNMKEINLNS